MRTSEQDLRRARPAQVLRGSCADAADIGVEQLEAYGANVLWDAHFWWPSIYSDVKKGV